MNTKYISSREREREREREATHEKATDWMEERNRLGREEGKERERERKEQTRSQDLKLAGVTWIQ
jgi:hypothetical protein